MLYRSSGGLAKENNFLINQGKRERYAVMEQPNKTAVITGITGQDGAYLTELLLNKGYRVYGTYRRTSSVNFWRLEELEVANHENLELVEYDLTDLSSTIRLLQMSGATEVYNLAAQSFVGVSFEQPITCLLYTSPSPRD